MAKKATRAEIEQRVSEVAELLLNRVPRRGIQQHAAKQGWGGNVRSVDMIIARATERIRELARNDTELELGKAKGALEMLFAKALAKGDLRTARLVQRDLTELLGLASPQRLEVRNSFTPPPQATTEELAQRFDELVRTQRARLKVAKERGLGPRGGENTEGSSEEPCVEGSPCPDGSRRSMNQAT